MDPAVLSVVLADLELDLNDTDRLMATIADMLREMGLMGESVDVPAGAPAMDRFLGLIGRDPGR